MASAVSLFGLITLGLFIFSQSSDNECEVVLNNKDVQDAETNLHFDLPKSEKDQILQVSPSNSKIKSESNLPSRKISNKTKRKVENDAWKEKKVVPVKDDRVKNDNVPSSGNDIGCPFLRQFGSAMQNMDMYKKMKDFHKGNRPGGIKHTKANPTNKNKFRPSDHLAKMQNQPSIKPKLKKKTPIVLKSVQPKDEHNPHIETEGFHVKKKARSKRMCLVPNWSGTTEFSPCKEEVQQLQQLPVAENSTVIETSELPMDKRFMPEVGNGHIATAVYSDSIFMNGLYNGANIKSHRARIPSFISVNASVSSGNISSSPKYRLDFGRGVFSQIFTTKNYSIEVRHYAHRIVKEALIVETVLESSDPITLNFTVNSGKPSEDINLTLVSPGVYSGRTKEAEYPEFNSTTSVALMCNRVPSSIVIQSGGRVTIFMYCCIGLDSAAVQGCSWRVRNMLEDGSLFASHVAAWQQLWQRGRVDIIGNDNLALTFYASYYYLLTALPLQSDPAWPFVGMSPGGLAHGSSGRDYQGHIFWDQDTWMFPAIFLLHSDLGRIIVDTRFRTYSAAVKYANMTGYKGARYPWESAFTGFNVCPWNESEVRELHVTGDTAWMIRQYIQLTKDTDFLKSGGYQALASMSEFWISAMVYNNKTGKYEIRNVMGPDEWNYPVNNSAYVNAVAAQTLNTAVFTASFINQTVPDLWKSVASSMYIPFDQQQNFHPEYDNYTRGTKVKQADIILLGFPLLWPMSNEIRFNDLTYYANVTPAGPAMTWSMLALNWLRLNNQANADAAFVKGMKNVQKPFLVWSENADGTGAVNFHTGMAGFLQSILYGYAGFEPHNDYLDFNPRLPPSTSHVSITGIDYLNSTVDLAYNEHGMNITLTNVTTPLSLMLTLNPLVVNLQVGHVVHALVQPARLVKTNAPK